VTDCEPVLMLFA